MRQKSFILNLVSIFSVEKEAPVEERVYKLLEVVHVIRGLVIASEFKSDSVKVLAFKSCLVLV